MILELGEADVIRSAVRSSTGRELRQERTDGHVRSIEGRRLHRRGAYYGNVGGHGRLLPFAQCSGRRRKGRTFGAPRGGEGRPLMGVRAGLGRPEGRRVLLVGQRRCFVAAARRARLIRLLWEWTHSRWYKTPVGCPRSKRRR